MQNDSIQDSTRYVVGNRHLGSILPGNSEEMKRDVFLDSNAEIIGGIWANELSIKGENISIQDSIYADNSIVINNQGEKELLIKSTCVSTESILVEEGSGKIKFQSDIYTKKIKLNNCIVLGNIFSENAVIENSIILGGVFATKELKIKDSIYYTFKADRVDLGKNLFQLSPVSLCGSPIELKNEIKVLTFLNIFEALEKETTGFIKLTQEDIIQIDEAYLSKLKEFNSELDLDEDEAQENKIFSLSMLDRVLDTYKIIEHFKFNKKVIESISLGAHYSLKAKKENFNKPLNEMENFLWNLLKDGNKINTLEGTSSINEFFERLNKQAMQS